MQRPDQADQKRVGALKLALRSAPAVLGVLLLIGAIYVVQHELRHLKLQDIKSALHAIPMQALVLSFSCTVLSYGVLTFYDRLGTIYAGHKVSYARVSFASFCAYALSHNLGFAAVSGAAVRYRLYAHWGLTPVQIAKTVAFCSLTFGLGGMVLGGAILFVEPGSIPFFGQRLPYAAMYAIGLAMWAVVIGYVTLARMVGTIRLFGTEAELPGWRMAIVQVVLATVDVAITASIMYLLLPAAPHLTWLIFLGVYLSSYTAGLATNLPGGIGVFDAALLLGLEPYLDAPQIVGAIVVFRLYYYVIPLFLAGSLFAGNEILLRGSALLRLAEQNRLVQAVARWSEPDLAVAAATGSVALCGVLLLCLGALAPQSDFSWRDPDLSYLVSEAGQFMPSLIGAGLIVMAIGLSHRVNLAWWMTIALLVTGAAFCATEYERMWISAILLLTVTLIAPFRRCFYRHARLLAGKLEPSSALWLFTLAICVMALAVSRHREQGLSYYAWWVAVLSSDVPNSLRLTLVVSVGLAVIAMWRLLRPGRVTWLPWDARGRQRLASLGGAVLPSRADGVVLGEAQAAGIPFRRCGRVLLGLGDPTGAEADRASTIWRMRDLAAQEGLDAAFWRAGPGLLKVYEDLGLTALPLGADGLPLPESVGDTPEVAEYLVCVAERDLNTLLPLLPELAGNQARQVPQAAD